MSTIKQHASLVNPPPSWVLHVSPSCPLLEAVQTTMLQLKLQIASLLFPQRSLLTQLGTLRKKSKQHFCFISSILLEKKGLLYQWAPHSQRNANLGSVIWASFTWPSSVINSMGSIAFLNFQSDRTSTCSRWNCIMIQDSPGSLGCWGFGGF